MNAIVKRSAASIQKQEEAERHQKLETELAAVFGDEKGQALAQDIHDFKAQNPGKVFSFIFDEHGKFQAFEKRPDIIEEDEI